MALELWLTENEYAHMGDIQQWSWECRGGGFSGYDQQNAVRNVI